MEKQFKSSINTKFDLGKSDIFNGYIPTNSHILPIDEIIAAGMNLSNKKSHLIIGPYGTGKSYLTTLLCSLLSKKYKKTNLKNLIKKFQEIGEYEETVNLISNIDTMSYTYIPVLMNGNEGTFRDAIIANLYSSVKQFDSSINLPGIPNTIKSIIKRWKSNYPSAYQTFINSIRNEKEFFEKIQNYDKEALADFETIYSDITFGEKLILQGDTVNFIQTFEQVLDILNKRKLGIVLAYDEFGRFLQTISPDEINGTMQDLQDLAELANNGSKNFELMLISHKNLNSYFQNYSEDLRNEFNRIEGRFSSYIIKSDQNVFASIIKNRLSKFEQRKTISEKIVEKYENSLRIYNLFDDLTPKAITELVIKGCYPIHPVTLWLLSSLSNIYGQNERTLFTFLDSNQPGGFRWFIEHEENDILYPSYLYEYFFKQDDHDIRNSFKIKTINKNIELIKGLSLDKKYLDVYIFICLWELAGLNDKQKINPDFISFAFSITASNTELIIEKLVSLKIVRYNFRINRYETTEGSSLDMEAFIREVEENSTFDNSHITKILSSLLSSNYKKIISYNEAKQMTRFAKLNIKLLNDSINSIDNNVDEEADFYIDYLIVDIKRINRETLINNLLGYNLKNKLFCITNIGIEPVEDICRRIHAIDILLHNEDFLSKDSNAKLELEYLKDEAIFNAEKQIEQINRYSKENYWIYNKNAIEINNEFEMQDFLSKSMYILYPKTPVISNDLYNKRFITGAQKKAGIQVIDNILSKKDCSGSGPDYLLYYSVFVNNNHDYLNEINVNSKLYTLQAELKEILKRTTDLHDVIDFFIDSSYGYGIRKPLIPILFTGLLSDVWDNLLFFNKNSYLMNLDAENIYEMFLNSEGITFKYHSYSEEQLETINIILDVFEIRSEDIGKPKHIKAGNAIYFWLKSLPRYSQITFGINEDIIKFRDTVNYFSIDPIESLNNLYVNFRFKITEIKQQLESFVKNKMDEFLHETYNLLSVKSYEELVEKITNSDQLVQITNPLADIAKNSTEKDFIDNCSQKLIGISIYSWSDNTVEVFKKEMSKYCNQVLNNEYDLNGAKVIEINGQKRIINKVEKFGIQAVNLEKRLNAMINAQNSRVTKDEIKNILYSLLQKSLD